VAHDHRNPKSVFDTDEQIVEGMLQGNQQALATAYDAYADRIHGFCHGMLRNSADAADATQQTFLIAAQRISQLRSPSALRPWLYSIARRHALAQFRSRSRVEADDEVDVTIEDHAGDDLEEGEMVSLVWDAAGGLAERDQLVLELSLRHDLSGDELAETLDVRRDHAYTLVANAKKRMGRAVGALLMARHGRRDCQTLDQLLQRWNGEFTTRIRNSVNKHIDNCDECARRRSRLTDPAAMFAAIPLLLAPAALRSQVLSGAGSALTPGTASAGTSANMASGALAAVSAKVVLIGVAAVSVIAIAGATAYFASNGNSSAQATDSFASAESLAPTSIEKDKPSAGAASESPSAAATGASEDQGSTAIDRSGDTNPPIDDDLLALCHEVVAIAASVPEIDIEHTGSVEVQAHVTSITHLLTWLDAQHDLPGNIRSEVDRALGPQLAFADAIEANGWNMEGVSPPPGGDSGRGLRLAIEDSCSR